MCADIDELPNQKIYFLDHGRIQIKVYRGPTEHDGHDHHAPWGYWVKQPSDDGHY